MLDFSTHAHNYQIKAAEHLWNSTAHGGVAALWLDPGYGKTMIVLHAFKALYDAGIVKNMLVFAPLRVVQTVWAQEIDEWASLNGLKAARLHGPKKEKWLERRDVQIWLVNYEGIPWVAKLAKAGKFPYCDVVVFDEVRRMKNAQGKRFKQVWPIAKLAKFKWGLTGTPVSNGLLDLHGQFLILDDGAALGRYITHYRNNYFEQHFDGFTYIPRPGAQDKIEAAIEKYVFRADGYLELPELLPHPIRIELDDKARRLYATMKRDMIAEYEGEKLTAANAAVLMTKLKQMANGRVYDEDRNVIEVHNAKADALQELLEELGDQQLLIAYEFNHDLTQLREILGDDLPYLGSGVTERTAISHVARWNNGEIRVLAAHPASAGHGLNLQKSNAAHILWWGPTIDLDHYIQFNDRIVRQGNKAAHVIEHTFITTGTVDETVIVARQEKDNLQSSVLRALTAEFGDSIKGPDNLNSEETLTMTDLVFKNDAQQGGNPFAPQGGGQPATQPASNPFSGGQSVQTANPNEASPGEVSTSGNPFFGSGPAATPQGQVQNIQNDVQAPAPTTPQQAQPVNPFAGTGQAQEPAQDAHVVQETPAAQAAPTTTQTPQDSTAAPATLADAMQTMSGNGGAGMVPFFTMIPVDKLDKVLSAIGRAVKDK